MNRAATARSRAILTASGRRRAVEQLERDGGEPGELEHQQGVGAPHDLDGQIQPFVGQTAHIVV